MVENTTKNAISTSDHLQDDVDILKKYIRCLAVARFKLFCGEVNLSALLSRRKCTQKPPLLFLGKHDEDKIWRTNPFFSHHQRILSKPFPNFANFANCFTLFPSQTHVAAGVRGFDPNTFESFNRHATHLPLSSYRKLSEVLLLPDFVSFIRF